MKIRHKVTGPIPQRTDTAWAARVEREAIRTTDATEAAYLKAQERLARAEAKATAEEQRKTPDRKRTKRLWAAVEARREELVSLARLANKSPAGSQNRGKGSYRGVPTGNPL